VEPVADESEPIVETSAEPEATDVPVEPETVSESASAPQSEEKKDAPRQSELL
jgi:hypothetical protein